jgi:Lrp/AsnC family leucine-responsive transcriptional regulator
LDENEHKCRNLRTIGSYDRKILSILSGEGRIAITELARRIGLSKTPCQARVRKLEAAGFIRATAPFWTPESWASDM